MSVSHPTVPVSTLFPITEEDRNFTAAESPVILNLNAALGKNVNAGQLDNKGPGILLVSVSPDGSDFGPTESIEHGETFRIKGLDVHSIKIQLLVASIASAYQIVGSDPGKELVIDRGLPINRAAALPPDSATGAAMTDTLILSATISGRRATTLCNNGAQDVFLAYGGNTAVIGSGECIPKGESKQFTLTHIDDDEIRGISIAILAVSIQVWSDLA